MATAAQKQERGGHLGRRIVLLGFLAMCVAAAEGAMTDWPAVYLHDEMHARAGLASSGLIAFSLAVAVGRLCGDWLATRFGPVPLVRIGGAIGGAGLAVGVASQSQAGALIGFAFMG